MCFFGAPQPWVLVETFKKRQVDFESLKDALSFCKPDCMRMGHQGAGVSRNPLSASVLRL